MKNAVVKKTIWTTENYSNALMYVLYTDFTYEEIRVNPHKGRISIKIECDQTRSYNKPIDGKYYRYKEITFKEIIDVKQAKINKFTKKEMHNYIDDQLNKYNKLIEKDEENKDKIWSSLEEFEEL